MSLLDAKYFSRVDCNIPQGTYNTITETISRYERDYLIQILGYELYKLVAAYAKPGSDQRIIDIVEGKEYTVGEYTVKWNGLTNTEKVSPMAYYCFIQHIRDNAVRYQNTGAVVQTVENGVVISPGVLIQRASLSCRELTGYAGQDALAPSLYNFLTNYVSDYPEWVFNEYGLENMFDL